MGPKLMITTVSRKKSSMRINMQYSAPLKDPAMTQIKTFRTIKQVLKTVRYTIQFQVRTLMLPKELSENLKRLSEQKPVPM